MCAHRHSPTAAPPCRLARLRWLSGSVVFSRRAPTRGRLSTSCGVNVVNTRRSRFYSVACTEKRWLVRRPHSMTGPPTPRHLFRTVGLAPAHRVPASGQAPGGARYGRSRPLTMVRWNTTGGSHRLHADDATLDGSVPMTGRARQGGRWPDGTVETCPDTVGSVSYSVEPSGQEPITLTKTVNGSSALNAS
jgi:hypothetical protein